MDPFWLLQPPSNRRRVQRYLDLLDCPAATLASPLSASHSTARSTAVGGAIDAIEANEKNDRMIHEGLTPLFSQKTRDRLLVHVEPRPQTAHNNHKTPSAVIVQPLSHGGDTDAPLHSSIQTPLVPLYPSPTTARLEWQPQLQSRSVRPPPPSVRGVGEDETPVKSDGKSSNSASDVRSKPSSGSGVHSLMSKIRQRMERMSSETVLSDKVDNASLEPERSADPEVEGAEDIRDCSIGNSKDSYSFDDEEVEDEVHRLTQQYHNQEQRPPNTAIASERPSETASPKRYLFSKSKSSSNSRSEDIIPSENKVAGDGGGSWLSGFTRASGKGLLSVSENAVKFARKFFERSPGVGDSTEPKLKQEPSSGQVDMSGFTSASGRKIGKTSKEALSKAKELIEVANEISESTPSVSRKRPPEVAGMFQKASGKKLKPPSSQDVERAKALLETDRFEVARKTATMRETAAAVSKPAIRQQPVLSVGRKSLPFRTPFHTDAINTAAPRRQSAVNLREQRRIPISAKPATRLKLSNFFSSCDVEAMFPGQGQSIPQHDEIRRRLIDEGAKETCASDQWVRHHLAKIVDKLQSYQQISRKHSGEFLNPLNVMHQIRYRYETEINLRRHSIVKRICEKDDTSVRPMVLYVQSVPRIADNHLMLSDGWYDIKAFLDVPLRGLLLRKRIRKGTKLLICGARVSEDVEAAGPLAETKPSIRICYNGVRWVPWHCKLGLVSPRLFLPCFLGSIKSRGGMIPVIDIVVARQYPLLFMETKEKGRVVFRDERSEDEAQKEFEGRQQVQENKKISRKIRVKPTDIKHISDAETLFQLLEEDGEGYGAMLTAEQHRMMEEYLINGRRPNDTHSVERPARSVRRCLSVRIISTCKLSSSEEREKTLAESKVLNIWDPPEGCRAVFKEGARLRIQNVKPVEKLPTHLSNSRFTIQKQMTGSEWYPERKFHSFEEIKRNPTLPFKECDIIAKIVHIHDSESKVEIFLADNSRHIAVLRINDIERIGKSFFKKLRSELIIVVQNASVGCHDARFDFVVLDQTKETHLTTEGKTRYVNEVAQLREWFSREDDFYLSALDLITSDVLQIDPAADVIE